MTIATFEENVKMRAFELFLERGGSHGNDHEDWFRAETELRGNDGSVKRKEGKVTKKRIMSR